MSRRYRAFVAVAMAAALAVTASGCTGSDDKADAKGKAPDKVTYLTAFGAVGRDAFAWVAQEKGYFKEANLEVNIQLGAATGENIQKLVGGQAQFANLDLIGGWITMGKKEGAVKDFRTIFSVHQQNLVSIIALENSGITTPKDLEGKKIAAATGSVNQLLFPAYAKLAGIDEKKVTWQNAQTTQLAGLLSEGKVNALSTFLIGQKGIEKVAGKKTVVLPYSQYLSDLYGNGIVASNKVLKDNPAMVKRFRDAMIKALKYTLEHPQEAVDILRKYNPASDATAAMGEISLMTPYCGTGNVIGTLDQQRVARALATLQGSGLIEPGLTPESVVDFSIAPKA